MQNAKKHEYKYRSNEYRWNIGEDNIAMPLKNAGAMTKSRRKRVDVLTSESETREMRPREFVGGWDRCMWLAVCFIQGGMDITVGLL